MTTPLQFASLYGGQEVFVWSNCLLDLGRDFLVGNMVFVEDAWYPAVAPHFLGSYSSLELLWSGTTVFRQRLKAVVPLNKFESSITVTCS